MGANKRLEFRLGEYLLRASSVNLKCLGEACFRDDIARTNTAQIAPKCLTAVCRAGIGAVKKAATRANIDDAGSKTFQYRNCKGDDDASTSRKSKTISSCAVAARKVATQRSWF